MVDLKQIDFSELDRPEILAVLFHPRPELKTRSPIHRIIDNLVPLDKNGLIGSRFRLTKLCPMSIFAIKTYCQLIRSRL